MITKEKLQERLKILNNGKLQNEQIAIQATNNANAHSGAIQECQYWLEQLLKEENQ